MKIETQTKFRCDGCGKEATVTHGWESLVPLQGDGMTYAVNRPSNDFCSDCVRRMYLALRSTS